MPLTLLAALLAAQVNPGLPPPWPEDGPFDISSVCFVVMTAEADREQGQGEDTRYLNTARGFFAAQIMQAHAGREPTAIAMAMKRVGNQPERFRGICNDAFAVSYARLGSSSKIGPP